MKFLLIAALSLFAVSALAEESLKDMKARTNTEITQKISSLESAKGCVNGAQTKEAFQACKFDLHKSMNMQKEEVKGNMDKTSDEMKKKSGTGY